MKRIALAFNRRVILGVTLCSVGIFLAIFSFAANPTAGWSIVTSPNNSTEMNTLPGATCTSPSQCWAVGYSADSNPDASLNQALIEEWNGVSWGIVPSPSASLGALAEVTCLSASECWAVGFYGGLNAQTLIEHWNGGTWSIVSSPNVSGMDHSLLHGVTCVSVTMLGRRRLLLPLLRPLSDAHRAVGRDGISWSIVSSPNTSISDEHLLRVTCSSASECWAVGRSGNASLIEHWDGTSWSIVASPNTSATQANGFQGVTCPSASECWAVGSGGNANGIQQTLIEHWTAASNSWSIVSSPNFSATQKNYLYRVTCSSASECWTVGNYVNSSGTDEALILHWDGTAWSIVTSPNPSAAQGNRLNAATCASSSDCWAVGARGTGSSYQTLIEHYTVAPTLTSAVSRKTHGSAGDFDVDLTPPASGIECRSGGANSDYTMIFTFSVPVTSCGVASTGTVTNGPGANQCTVQLTGVPNTQYTTVQLIGVLDGSGNPVNAAAPWAFSLAT